MYRKLGSLLSTVALLAVAVGAAAVNVRILHSNRTDASVLNVREAADVTPLNNPVETQVAAATMATTEPVALESADASEPGATPADSTPKSHASAPNARHQPLGKVGRSGDDGDEAEEDGDGDHMRGPRGGFMQLAPEQLALLRVAALAQVRPIDARDAARGIGPEYVINLVKAAAERIGVPLSDLAAINNLPPERGRGHGGHDDEFEGDDDD